MSEYYLGLMSGTSIDGIDAVLVDFAERPYRLLASHQHAWPADLLAELQAAAKGAALSADQFAALDSRVGEQFARAASACLAKAANPPVLAIGSHGQTLAHAPNAMHPYSLQIGNPAIIAERTGVTTVADFRRRDIAAGGQGAPLVPAFHAQAFASSEEDRVILNIGGIANITVLPRASNSELIGFDTGPGNCLMDAWIRQHKNQRFDADGGFAASGQPNAALLELLLQDPYFKQAAPKSTGTDYFSLSWLEKQLGDTSLRAEDIQATLLALSASSISQAISQYCPDAAGVWVCGGGVHNKALMQALSTRLPCPLHSTEAMGIDPDWVEAIAFAWLARETLNGRPSNLPSVSGASGPRILGAIYPA